MCIFARRMEVYLPLLHSLTYIFTKYKSYGEFIP